MAGIGILTSFKSNIDGSAAASIVSSEMLSPDMRKRAEKVLARAQDTVAVLTGALRDSGHIEETAELQFDVVFDAPVKNGSGSYARYVEEGTYKMAAQPFLRPSLPAAFE